jgi:hypothetical protein
VFQHELIDPWCITTPILQPTSERYTVRVLVTTGTYLVQPEIPQYVSTLMRNVKCPIIHPETATFASVHSTQIADKASTIKQSKLNVSIGMRQASFRGSHDVYRLMEVGEKVPLIKPHLYPCCMATRCE